MFAFFSSVVMVLGLCLYSVVSHAEMLSAKFETTQCARPCREAKPMQWWLMREDQSVEIRTLTAQGQLASHSSLWEHRAHDKLYYLYLMHDEKRVIQYSNVDLNILGLSADQRTWALKSQLIAAEELKQLQKTQTAEVSAFGHVLEHYQGQWQEGTEVDVLWIPALQLPYRVRYVYPQHTVEVNLKQLVEPALAARDPSVPVKASSLQLSQYQWVDYTDIGDMEHQPDDLAWMAKAVGAPGLHHEHHAH